MQPFAATARNLTCRLLNRGRNALCQSAGNLLQKSFGRSTGLKSGLVAITVCLGVFQTAQAQSDYPEDGRGNTFHIVSNRNEMILTERFARVLELDSRITRVDGFDPAILSVQALTPHRIRLQAAASGVTTLILVDEFDKTYEIEVFVEGDVRHLQSYINRFFPDSSVTAVKVKDSIVLRGVVSDPSHISQITEVAEEFYPKVINHMQFGAANQVRLQVRIMEAQRSRIRKLGFNWSLLTGSGYVASSPGNLGSPSSVTLNQGGGNSLIHGGASLSDSTISFGLVGTGGIFRGFLEALKQEGLLRILVETSVVADSGRPASLLSGGEFPILVPQALGTTTVEWREFGVKLEAVPIVLGQGQVILEIAPEFSERDFANAATLNSTVIPAITTRRANTQVRMKFGQTLMIGGLIATRYTAETDKVPFLGELPGIGAAFRRVRYDENETELIILVTPEYVAPLDPCQVPEGGPGAFSDIPTDRELYRHGIIEVPNYGGPTPPGFGQEAMMYDNHGGYCPPNGGYEMMEPHSMGQPTYQMLPPNGDELMPPAESYKAPPYVPESMPLPTHGTSAEPMPLLPMPGEPSQPMNLDSSIPAVPKLPPAMPTTQVDPDDDIWAPARGRSNVQLTEGYESPMIETNATYAVHKSKSETQAPPALIAPQKRSSGQESQVSAPNP
ncbi:MAG TPA: hypothetical protein DD473_07970 [Planctomycetaceae bacterium]|nr:hypothetical protein [Planctomycetaceae bacterium]